MNDVKNGISMRPRPKRRTIGIKGTISNLPVEERVLGVAWPHME